MRNTYDSEWENQENNNIPKDSHDNSPVKPVKPDLGNRTIEDQESADRLKLIIEVIDTGWFLVFTSLPNNFKAGHIAPRTSGFQNFSIPIKEKGHLFSGDITHTASRSLEDGFSKHKVTERLFSYELKRPKFKTVLAPTRAGGILWKLGKTVITETSIPDGEESVAMKVAVSWMADVKENTGVLMYHAETPRGNYDSALKFIDYSNRSGNSLRVKIALPMSVLQRLQAQIEKDPRFIRELVKGILLYKYEIPEESLTFLPPYGNWDKEGAKMYVDTTNGWEFKTENLR